MRGSNANLVDNHLHKLVINVVLLAGYETDTNNHVQLIVRNLFFLFLGCKSTASRLCPSLYITDRVYITLEPTITPNG